VENLERTRDCQEAERLKCFMSAIWILHVEAGRSGRAPCSDAGPSARLLPEKKHFRSDSFRQQTLHCIQPSTCVPASILAKPLLKKCVVQLSTSPFPLLRHVGRRALRAAAPPSSEIIIFCDLPLTFDIHCSCTMEPIGFNIASFISHIKVFPYYPTPEILCTSARG
jgi:hypothetical protein